MSLSKCASHNNILLKEDKETENSEEETELRPILRNNSYRAVYGRSKTAWISKRLCRLLQMNTDKNGPSCFLNRFLGMLGKTGRQIYPSPLINSGKKYFTNQSLPLPIEDVHLRTLITKAATDQSKLLSSNLYVKLERVAVCRRCENILDDASLLLYNLMEEKMEKIQLSSTDDGMEYCLCCVCKVTTQDEESMKRHLLKHMESNEILCRHCEELINDSSDYYLGKNKLPKKDMEKVRLSNMILSCKLCNEEIFNKQILLPEIMTIGEYMFYESIKPKTYNCYLCDFDLSATSKREADFNYISSRMPICEECEEKRKSSAPVQKRCSMSSWLSTHFEEEPLFSKHFTPRHWLQRRHIYFCDRNEPLHLQVTDFLIKDVFSNLDKTWYTCRFCCYSSIDQLKMIGHVENHITVHQAVCDNCQTDVSWS